MATTKRKTLREGQFPLWVTLPEERRSAVRAAAGQMDLPMSEFARRAVLEAVRRIEAGERPFTEEDGK